jgi:hypothetical protein
VATTRFLCAATELYLVFLWRCQILFFNTAFNKHQAINNLAKNYTSDLTEYNIACGENM